MTTSRLSVVFYAALNTVIATGDVSGLEAMVGAGLLAPETGAQSGDSMPLAERLRVLHAARSDLWLRVEDMIADGDRIVHGLPSQGSPSR